MKLQNRRKKEEVCMTIRTQWVKLKLLQVPNCHCMNMKRPKIECNQSMYQINQEAPNLSQQKERAILPVQTPIARGLKTDLGELLLPVV
jgi:hypothetical protein